MECLGWFFSIVLWTLNIFAIFTVCVLTLRKGHALLGLYSSCCSCP